MDHVSDTDLRRPPARARRDRTGGRVDQRGAHFRAGHVLRNYFGGAISSAGTGWSLLIRSNSCDAFSLFHCTTDWPPIVGVPPTGTVPEVASLMFSATLARFHTWSPSLTDTEPDAAFISGIMRNGFASVAGLLTFSNNAFRN